MVHRKIGVEPNLAGPEPTPQRRPRAAAGASPMTAGNLRASIGIFGIAAAATPAWAVPSYTRQTGEPCTSCHVGAYGPALTPHGRAFKLGGYSDGHFVVPLSGSALVTF